MEFPRKIRRLARKIIQDAHDKALLEGIVLELATHQYDHKGRMVPYDYDEWRILKTKLADKLGDDTASADIKTSGAPGSKERIDAYAKHYAEREDSTQSIVSPFSVDLDDLAEGLAGLLALASHAKQRAKFLGETE